MPNCTRWKRDLCAAFDISEADLHLAMRQHGFYACEAGREVGRRLDMAGAISGDQMLIERTEGTRESDRVARRGR